MVEHPKQDLKAIEKVLGVDLSNDAEIQLRSSTAKEQRVLRIKSLGSHAYDISSSIVDAQQPKADLKTLEKLAGMDLSGDAEISVTTSAATPVSKVLRLKSLGSHAYDISSGRELPGGSQASGK